MGVRHRRTARGYIHSLIPCTRMADLIRVLLSVLIPPPGVFFKVGIGLSFWVNILLTILGYIPGLVHAIWILASKRS